MPVVRIFPAGGSRFAGHSVTHRGSGYIGRRRLWDMRWSLPAPGRSNLKTRERDDVGETERDDHRRADKEADAEAVGAQDFTQAVSIEVLHRSPFMTSFRLYREATR